MAGEVVLIDPQTGLSYRSGAGSTANGSVADPAPTVTAGRDSAGAVRTNRALADGTQVVNTGPSADANAALTPQVSQGTFSQVVKASAGNFYGGAIVAGATAGFLISYNANAAPASGAALTPALVLGAVPVAAGGFATLGDYTLPDRFTAGITLLFSTSLATFTQPANAAVFIRGRAA